MFCTSCGFHLDEQAGYCSQCGTATARGLESTLRPRLMRSRYDKKIAGVCGGLAVYLVCDPTLVRVVWLVLSLALPPAGLIGYIAAWIIIPKEPARLMSSIGAEASQLPL